MPPGNSEDKRWTQRKAKPARRAAFCCPADAAQLLSAVPAHHPSARFLGNAPAHVMPPWWRPSSWPSLIALFDRRADIRLTGGKGLADLTVPLATIIETVVKQNKVVAFIKGSRTAPECGFSQRLVGILTETGADFEVVNVLDSVRVYCDVFKRRFAPCCSVLDSLQPLS